MQQNRRENFDSGYIYPSLYQFIRQCSWLLTKLYLYRLKTASATKQEQARLEVENAEDDLVQKTEVAITLMKTVLDNVRKFHK